MTLMLSDIMEWEIGLAREHARSLAERREHEQRRGADVLSLFGYQTTKATPAADTTLAERKKNAAALGTFMETKTGQIAAPKGKSD